MKEIELNTTEIEVGDIVEALEDSSDGTPFYKKGDLGIVLGNCRNCAFWIDFNTFEAEAYGKGIWYVRESNLRVLG